MFSPAQYFGSVERHLPTCDYYTARANLRITFTNPRP